MATQRTFTAEDVQKKIQALPPEVASLMYSPEMVADIQKVGERNKLHYDQMGTLEVETINVMLGFTETADYPHILTQSLGVDQAQADAIAKDINDTLFSKIREAMKTGEITKTNPEATISSSAPAATAAPTSEKSVIMPSAAKASVLVVPATATPAPVITPSAPVATPIVTPEPMIPQAPAPSTAPATASPTPAIVKPAGLPTMPHVDVMLSEPTMSIAPKPAAPTPTSAAPATPANATTPAPVDVKKSDAPAPPPIYKTDPYHEPID